ncbi:MAG TPA: hypothetical protein VEJ84_01615 [Acidimicrobiales bacterium]|nr:hypothetical protein [Acidimicrobiales bacterium]
MVAPARPVNEARIASIAFCLLALAAALWWMWLGRGTTFLYDEWDFILAYHQGLWTALVDPHDGQFDAITVLVYRALFAVFGISHYWPFRLVGVVFEIVMLSVAFAYLSRRIPAFLALVAIGALMANGQAWEDILWPLELTFTISLASGVGALMLLDRCDRVGDALAALCLAISVASSGFGLVFIAGVAAEQVWSGMAGRRDLGEASYRPSPFRRVWVIVPALILYLAWYLHENVHDAVLSRIDEVPHYVVQSAGYGAGTLIGIHGVVAGEVLAAAAGLVLATRLVLDWRTGARLVMWAVAALTFWALLALARAAYDVSAATSRYLQPDSLFLVLALAELASPTWAHRLRAVPAKWRASTQPIAAKSRGRAAAMKAWTVPEAKPGPLTTVLAVTVAVVATLGGVSNSATLVEASHLLQSVGSMVRGDLRAVELTGHDLPASFEPLPNDAPQITVGPYLGAVAALGSPADTDSQLLASSEAVRESADQLFIRALRLSVTSVAEGRERPGPGFGSVHSCPSLKHNVGPHLLIELRRPAFLVLTPSRSPVAVRLRLVASKFSGAPIATVAAGSTGLIIPRATRALALPVPYWHVELTVEGQGTAVACPLR